jgi:signal transduction histidine kinase/ABC-type nitrate/sulfonate/bicarbonate transport system substrate-binding protein
LYRYFIFIIFLPFPLSANEVLQKTILQLSWFNQFQFAGYYIAKEKGFYKDFGLDVDIKDFNLNINVTKEVSEGKVDFGIARETLISEKINTYHNIIALYPLLQISPLILIAKRDSNINNIKDFKNKRIMLSENDKTQASIKAIFISNNINQTSLSIIKHTHNINDLIDNKVDIMSAYVSKAPFTLIQRNIPFNTFSPKDYGFDFYSDFLFTNNELIKKNLAKVLAFKKASLKGWEYAYSNIEESVDLILEKYNTQNLTKEELLFEAKELKKLSYYKNNALGNVDKNKLIRIYDTYRLMGQFEDCKNPTDFIFDESKPVLNKDESNYLENKDTLKMCMRTNFLPYENFSNKNPFGINYEYIKFLQKKLDINISLVATNTEEESFLQLENHNCDFLSSTQENKNFISTKPYLELPYVFVSLDNNSFVTSFEQLKSKKLFMLDDDKLVNILKQNYPSSEIYTTPYSSSAFKQILSNNADGYIGNIAEVIHDLQKSYNVELNITGNLEYNTKLFLYVRKDDSLLRNIFNKIIENTTKEEKELILDDYTSIRYKEVINHKSIFLVLLVSSLVISLLVIVYIRESILKNKIQKLNTNLEKRVIEESTKNRKKDEILFKQAKLASMGEMINNIAHQWRQPLNRINLSIQVIENILKGNSHILEQKELIDKKIFHINKNISYMSNTLEDFMNFFHPNKEKNSFCLNSLIKKAITLVQNSNNDIEFDVEIDKQINIYTFENEFLQVLLILLENSIDCFKKTKIHHKYIGIFANIEKEKIILYIRDNAGGISSTIIDKIFEPYFTTKFKNEGSGLGLYMAKMLIEESIGGKIDVYSQNSYTNFKITLPKENECQI